MAGVKRSVCLVSGAGYMFSEISSPLLKLSRAPTRLLYRLAFKLSHKTWFQNPDDAKAFVEADVIASEKVLIIKSGGIDTEEYRPGIVSAERTEDLQKELGIPGYAHCVLMVASRLVWSKGVREFVEASKILYERYPDWYFIMLCPRDVKAPDSVPMSYINEQSHKRLKVVDVFRNDARTFEALSDVMVLPSYYPEGVPRSLLEALALGKPVVTTQHQGCREIVEDGKNGYLVPVRDAKSLAARLSDLFSDPLLCEKFGRYSRLKAEREFSNRIVLKRIIEKLYEIPLT
jgi:N,N'-diacetylbacillosaminyl-diphospho-undecaprenol alpha-1,3-N-acetylgalactosaminyltransferase